MKKVICGLLLFAFFAVLSQGAIFAGEDYNVIMYDYETEQTFKLYIPDQVSSSALSLPSANEEEAEPFSVIGADKRTRVTPDVAPYKSVLCLQMGFDFNDDGIIDQWTIGTGAMVSSDVMLTCAHNIYWYDKGKYAKEVRVFVQQNDEKLSDTYYYPKKWSVPSEYVKSKDINYDWCVVKLQESIGNTIGWFNYNTSSNIVGKSISISGYPDQKGKQYFQYKDSGLMQSTSEYRFNHSVDTEGGQSGSPVYDSSYTIWGIHTHGLDSSTGRNSGTLITSRVCNTIEEMKK